METIHVNQIMPGITIKDVIIREVGEEKNAELIFKYPYERNYYVIHFIIEGEGMFYRFSKNNPLTIKKNSAFAIFKHDSVSYQSSCNNPLYYLWIGFDGEEAENIMQYLGFSQNNLIINLINPQSIIDAFQSLFLSWKNQDNYSLVAHFYNLIFIMKKNNPYNNIIKPTYSNINLLEHANNYIVLHLNQNIKVNDIADYLHINRSYFSKLFKKHTNMSPHQYITRLRLDRAEKLLITTDYSINEIASMLNFADIYSFSKLFSKHYGISPWRYRKKIHK